MKSKILVLSMISTFLSVTPVAAEDVTDSLSLEEVVVTGTRNATDIRHLPMTVTVIEREKLTEQHQTSVLPTVMQQVPGLFVTSRSMMGYAVSTGAAGGINLRGITGGAGQLLVLIDGHPQYNGIYGHPIADSYQTLMAERVEVLRGPASVLYGSNAMGGVLNIVTRSMRENGVRTTVDLGVGSYGTIQAEASNQLRSGKFSSTLSAQYSRTDNHRPRMGFEQYGGYLKLGYDINNHWNTYIDANLTHFNASYPGTVSSPLYDADQWITRGVVSAALENHYNRTSGALSVYTNFGRHKIDDGTANPEQPTQRYFRSKDALIGVSWYQSAQLFEGNRLTVGVDYQHIYGHAYYTSKQTGEVLDTPNKQSGKSYRNEIAGYVDFRQDLTSWLTIDAGLRVDHHSVVGTEWVPQAGVVVRPIQTGEIKAMVSKGFRNPTMREMYLYPPSNEELKPERLWNYELSWKHRLGAFNYGANLFYIKGDNMIQTVNRQNVNTGAIKNYGMELEADWRISNHWAVSTNHSLLHMEHHVIAAPTYKGFLGANYNCDKWSVIAGLQYISGLYTAVGDAEQKENFCLLNASVNYALTKYLTLWVHGENLLAQSYEINLGYPMPRATFMGGVNLRF
ncbi:TonB-dependent receptor plug domain-containing protein [Prevotella sp. tf2-5]|uniref:TonB-dependent receptor plug domain-containing protein n=1 Tax=Prevotella sp. tf2-5 TaxID=1761889 RepID=UPI00351178BE